MSPSNKRWKGLFLFNNRSEGFSLKGDSPLRAAGQRLGPPQPGSSERDPRLSATSLSREGTRCADTPALAHAHLRGGLGVAATPRGVRRAGVPPPPCLLGLWSGDHFGVCALASDPRRHRAVPRGCRDPFAPPSFRRERHLMQNSLPSGDADVSGLRYWWFCPVAALYPKPLLLCSARC